MPDPGPRIERRRSAAREEFVAAARLVVERDGFRNFSLEQVAQRVGLRKQAIYHYFASKEAVLFEVIVQAHTEVAHAVADAVAQRRSAAGAVEALQRTYFDHYRTRLALFQLCHTVAPAFDLARAGADARVERIHPLNELLLGGVVQRLVQQHGGAVAADARRFAFTAYTSVIGLLAMKALVESVGDPLRHADDPLLDTLVATYRHAAKAGSLR